MDKVSSQHFLLPDFLDKAYIETPDNKKETLIQTLQNTWLSPKLEVLSNGTWEYAKKYLHPFITPKLKIDFDGFKILNTSKWLIVLWIIKHQIYINDINNEQDKGIVLQMPYSRRFSKNIFFLPTVVPLGDDKVLAVVRSKQRIISWPYVDTLHIVDMTKRTAITLPEVVAPDVEFLHCILDNSPSHFTSHKKGITLRWGKIIFTWEFTKSISEYLSKCDDTHDQYESRSYRGESFFADCELDITTWKMSYSKRNYL